MTLPAGRLSSRSAFTIADDASYLAGCAKDFKTSAEASRITAEWMPRATASMRSRRPGRDWPLPYLVQRTDHTLYATGRTGRKFRRNHLHNPARKAPTVRGTAIAPAA